MRKVLLTGFMKIKKPVYCLKALTVTPEGGNSVKFSAGDLVTFPSGMNCRWEVHQSVRKHYRFGD